MAYIPNGCCKWWKDSAPSCGVSISDHMVQFICSCATAVGEVLWEIRYKEKHASGSDIPHTPALFGRFDRLVLWSDLNRVVHRVSKLPAHILILKDVDIWWILRDSSLSEEERQKQRSLFNSSRGWKLVQAPPFCRVFLKINFTKIIKCSFYYDSLYSRWEFLYCLPPCCCIVIAFCIR